MLWAALVAFGVAVVSMAILGARLTRRPDPDPPTELEPAADPDDPWSAWRPRPFEEHERPPRPRIWPVLAALTGLVLVGSGLAGARQALTPPEAVAHQPTTEPFLIEVEAAPTLPPAATPLPATPRPRAPIVAAKPQATAPIAPTTAAAAKTGPEISGTASCSDGKLRLSYSVKPKGANLSWVGVYLDKKVVRGGPVGDTGHSGSVERPASAGDHEFEVTADDKGGGHSRRQFRTHCA